ncbi:polysaccharide biosynthesis protein [Frankia sp. AgB1.9]|uniref:polysaccharide biosynthesis protein n=1 Tax=unclassified Frankia TaxID=2632575 RepID=UPI00193246DD|nr:MULTISPECIES: polysaccharide biosynthesis protein [unclassified Frankia]MBL7491004.1 polysaccharide biosynthesis protein [Frankia sp. AgW1.1]MBL7552379.1 polysaccharide biosynthesis protein [Frankia sp. AgB1.9]MBL7622122.1 polysaccharide biosynthesis protein [Frankia sp. AgB1.8]
MAESASNTTDSAGMLSGRRILVTGGTGSLGQVLIRRILSGEAGVPAKVIVLSRDEAKQHAMRLAYLRQRVTTDETIYRNFDRILEFRLGDVRNYWDVAACVRDADIVVNAAALKQVPACEYFPDQAILTNCSGASNIVRAVAEHGYQVDCVVGVGTDKCCKPVNVMGMTKALQERIFIAANVGVRERSGRTRFVGVRYGNVLASRGSVIPLFLDQIARGGPVTVTVADMTRFLVTLDEAVDMIFHSIHRGRPGEILVPRTPASTVLDIAHALIGDRDIPVEVVGVRPGEKMHEVMVSEEECHRTRLDGQYYVISPMLPELGEPSPTGELAGEYSSADNVVGLAETAALLSRNNLLPSLSSPAPGSPRPGAVPDQRAGTDPVARSAAMASGPDEFPTTDHLDLLR